MNTVSISTLKPTPGAADKRVTISSAAGGITLNGDTAVPTFDAATKYVVLDVQGQTVSVTFDGSAPTTTNGHFLYAQEKLVWSKAAASAAKFIRQGGSDATIHASEFTD